MGKQLVKSNAFAEKEEKSIPLDKQKKYSIICCGKNWIN